MTDRGFVFRRALLLGWTLVCAGCSLTPQQRITVDEAAAVRHDARLVHTPAIASEFHALADEAFAEAESGTAEHVVTILNVGEDALLARIHLIRAARRTIDLQTFIWVDDDTGRWVFLELLRTARRGVKVRLLADHFCKTSDPQILAQAATAHANLDVKIYNPVFDRATNLPLQYTASALFKLEMLNQRMHNKVFIVDQRIGIVGGRNIEDRYFDWDPWFNFKDRDVIVAGPAAGAMQASFDDYWDHSLSRNALHLVDVSQEVLKQPETVQEALPPGPLSDHFQGLSRLADHYSLTAQRPTMQRYRAARIEFVADVPEKTRKGQPRGGAVTARINEVLSSAEHSIVMQTPYMLLGNKSVRVFKKLRREQPDIELMFSTNSLAATDAFYVYAMSFKQRKLLVKRLRFQVHELKPIPDDVQAMVPRYQELCGLSRVVPYNSKAYQGIVPIAGDDPRVCIHAKSFVVDSRVAFVGSHNFEPRSNKLNTESGVFIWDMELAQAIEGNIRRDAAPQNSWVLGERKRLPVASNISDVVGTISRALPLFDIWPMRYSTCYQLKADMAPRSPFDPQFRDHYDDVGTFPEVTLTGGQLATRFIAAFGGWAKPLM